MCIHRLQFTTKTLVFSKFLFTILGIQAFKTVKKPSVRPDFLSSKQSIHILYDTVVPVAPGGILCTFAAIADKQ